MYFIVYFFYLLYISELNARILESENNAQETVKTNYQKLPSPKFFSTVIYEHF